MSGAIARIAFLNRLTAINKTTQSTYISYHTLFIDKSSTVLGLK
jgi:hypothetical protein